MSRTSIDHQTVRVNAEKDTGAFQRGSWAAGAQKLLMFSIWRIATSLSMVKAAPALNTDIFCHQQRSRQLSSPPYSVMGFMAMIPKKSSCCTTGWVTQPTTNR